MEGTFQRLLVDKNIDLIIKIQRRFRKGQERAKFYKFIKELVKVGRMMKYFDLLEKRRALAALKYKVDRMRSCNLFRMQDRIKKRAR